MIPRILLDPLPNPPEQQLLNKPIGSLPFLRKSPAQILICTFHEILRTDVPDWHILGRPHTADPVVLVPGLDDLVDGVQDQLGEDLGVLEMGLGQVRQHFGQGWEIFVEF